MRNLVASRTAPTCVWMDAGVLTYRLCDRGFDCEHCPLDAALRGVERDSGRTDAACARRRAMDFPDDRVYSRGHTWVQIVPGRGGLVRFGLDGFSPWFLGTPRRLRWMPSRCSLDAGETLCEIELDEGVLPLGTPLTARAIRWNRTLADHPSSIVAAPYADGWIAELDPIAPEGLDRLLEAAAARTQARHDARWFRRHVALHLLADEEGLEPPPSGNAAPLTDVRRMLGGSRYLALVRELIH